MTIKKGDQVRFRIPRGQPFSGMVGICTIKRFEPLKRKRDEVVYIDIHESTFAHNRNEPRKWDDLDMRCATREVEFAPLGSENDAFVPYMMP